VTDSHPGPSSDAPPGWDRQSRFLLAALALLMLASLPFLVQPFYEVSDETNDASMYILSAQALLRGEGYAYLGQPFIARPPGMSLLLAPIVAWRGLDFAAMHVLVSLFGIAGALLLFVWARPRVGSAVASALALCLWLNPGYQHFSNEVMSDVPGAALVLAILVGERWAARRPAARRELCLGALIGLATYVRTACVLALPAILAARVLSNLRAREARGAWLAFLRQRAGLATLACVLVMLPWSVRNALDAPPPPTDQNFIYSYWTGIFHADAGDPGSPLRPLSELAAIFPERVRAIADLLGARLEGRGAAVPAWILGTWVAACVAVLLVRQARSSEIFFCLVGVVLVTYFGFRVRLGLPMYVIGLAAWAETHLALASRFLGAPRARVLVTAALLALTALDFQPRSGRTEIEQESGRERAQARAFAEALPPDARLGARVGWHYALLLERPVWSLRFAIDRSPKRNVAAMEGVIDRYGLNTVLIGPSKIESFYLPYLTATYGDGQRVGDGWVFRVRP
jgi:4-amino-4-deoxy-L-arabinose transferase-like glycosyltransferase